MNGLEEIQKIIKNFVNESKQAKQQITEIETKRTQLAQERNEKKYANTNKCEAEISALGKQISELGNQSQELQNKLNIKFNEVKKLVNLTIDNLIAEEIRKVRKIDEERQDLEDKILLQKERETKYEMQKQEFYERFGRMPELSENAKKEDEVQDRQCLTYKARIEEIKELVENEEVRLVELAKIKRDFKNGNWSNILDSEDIIEETEEIAEEIETVESVEKTEKIVETDECIEEAEKTIEIIENVEEEAAVLPLIDEETQIEEFEPIEKIQVEEFEPIEEIQVEKFEPIEEIQVEKFEPVEEMQVEKFEPVEEVQVEEFEPVEEIQIEEIKTLEEVKTEELLSEEQEQKPIDEIEELAKAIVEEIVAEQTKDLNIGKVEEQQEGVPETKIEEQEIITYEEKEKEEEKVKIPAFEENVIISNIIAKIEDGEVVYKAQISNGEEIKVYPAKLTIGNAFLNDKEIREEIKEVLINYAVAEYRVLDKNVIKKIDPTVCEVLNRFAKKYNYDARNLIYNYAMSFSKKEDVEVEAVPIIYNFSYIGNTNLSKKEKVIISKICKNAIKNEKVDVIGCVTGIGKIKYMLKRIFATNNANALPEGKY